METKNIDWFDGYQITETWLVISFKYWISKILKPGTTASWYSYVILRRNKQSKLKTIHRLVAETFIPNPNNLPLVLHNDNNPKNCHKNNLRWWTHQDNMKQRNKEGRCKSFWKWKFSAENNKSKKIDQFTTDWHFLKTWKCAADVKREIWISNSNISSCIQWKLKTAGWYIWKTHF